MTLEDGHVIGAEYVINCAGMWARQLGESHGVSIPNQAVEHYYLITGAMPQVGVCVYMCVCDYGSNVIH